MGIRNTPLFPATVDVVILAVAFMLPACALAAGIGEIKLLSMQGEPLHIYVALIPGQGEQVESSCLSLVAPDTSQQDTGTFLTEASLSVITDGKQQYVDIKSSQSPSIAFTRLRLQIKCPGVLGLTKTLTIPHPSSRGNSLVQSAPNSAYSEKINTGELITLPEQQKQLSATLEGMQQKIQLLEGELKEIKLHLAQISTTSSSVVADAQNNNLNLAAFIKHWLVEGVLEAIEMMALAFLFLWLGLRFYNRKKSSARIDSRQPPGSLQITTDNAPVSSMANIQSPPATTATGKTTPPFSFSLEKADESVVDDNSMLEEANLYAANGRMEKAVEILKEIIGRSPSNENAWKLLLSVYSALGRTLEFEKTAQNFLKHHKTSPSWNGIQVLGRTLDRDNPLYVSQSKLISASPLLPDAFTHRPIGDVLVEMGALSKQEMLKYLDEFDPNEHGRFGGYLVARKAITLAELDLALLRQQGTGNVETKPDGLPSLQEIEKLLDEFDPKQHGSVIKFLASRNIALPEQLSQYLLQQKNSRQALNKPRTSNTVSLSSTPYLS